MIETQVQKMRRSLTVGGVLMASALQRQPTTYAMASHSA